MVTWTVTPVFEFCVTHNFTLTQQVEPVSNITQLIQIITGADVTVSSDCSLYRIIQPNYQSALLKNVFKHLYVCAYLCINKILLTYMTYGNSTRRLCNLEIEYRVINIDSSYKKSATLFIFITWLTNKGSLLGIKLQVKIYRE